MITGALLLLSCVRPAISQTAGAAAEGSSNSSKSNLRDKVFDYLGMAGSQTAADFRPLSQRERNSIYAKSLINPIWYLKGASSGAVDLKNDKPEEWEQGASGYGKRVGNIMGQYAVQRTVTFGLSSLLREDTRYFGSGKKGFWRRTGYALASSVLARHDNGKQYFSFSQVAGFAAGAFVSRAWQPPSTQSAGDAAVSFGVSMGWNVAVTEVKEFLPDMLRPLLNRRKHRAPPITGEVLQASPTRNSKSDAAPRHLADAWQTGSGDSSASNRLPPPGCGTNRRRQARVSWQQIAELTVHGAAGKSRLPMNPERSFRLIKLRSRHGDVEVYRWTLHFDDGSLQELSINCLFQGAESRSILIAGRRLKEMVVEYDAPRTTQRGVLEILAQLNLTP